jgi:hypothetical protein
MASPGDPPTRVKRLRSAVSAAVTSRVSLERTRRATRLERYTVGRLSWDQLIRLNRWLEVSGKATTALWGVFIVTVVLGADWKQTVQDALNSGQPIRGAIVLVIVMPTLLFVAARSGIGFARWRLQREFWRREVEQLGAQAAKP